MDKYGFVYLWFDRKHKRFYIGSHWGFEDDGYICSSRWMKQAYSHRPEDFKRRILKRVYTNRHDLLDAETEFLIRIKDAEIKTKYYNLSNKNKGHWVTKESSKESVAQKVSKALTGKPSRSKTKFKKGQSASPETTFKKGNTAHNKGKSLEERYGPERAAQIREKQRVAHLGKPSNSSTKYRIGNESWNKR